MVTWNRQTSLQGEWILFRTFVVPLAALDGDRVNMSLSFVSL